MHIDQHWPLVLTPLEYDTLSTLMSSPTFQRWARQRQPFRATSLHRFPLYLSGDLTKALQWGPEMLDAKNAIGQSMSSILIPKLLKKMCQMWPVPVKETMLSHRSAVVDELPSAKGSQTEAMEGMSFRDKVDEGHGHTDQGKMPHGGQALDRYAIWHGNIERRLRTLRYYLFIVALALSGAIGLSSWFI